jgi:hypothetical protein
MKNHWVTDLKNGQAYIPTNSNFHPNLFIGTKEEYHAKLDEIFGKMWCNDNGKVIGSHAYTEEEYNNLKPRY